jgi:hypothetical protein
MEYLENKITDYTDSLKKIEDEIIHIYDIGDTIEKDLRIYEKALENEEYITGNKANDGLIADGIRYRIGKNTERINNLNDKLTELSATESLFKFSLENMIELNEAIDDGRYTSLSIRNYGYKSGRHMFFALRKGGNIPDTLDVADYEAGLNIVFNSGYINELRTLINLYNTTAMVWVKESPETLVDALYSLFYEGELSDIHLAHDEDDNNK